MADSRKRTADGVVDNISLYDDPNELVNAVISVLNVPEQKTAVSENYANDKNLASEVQAYAKIAGNNWTYYVKTLNVSIGRNTEVADAPKEGSADIDLGPAKVVSRAHASISYNVSTRHWELYVQGRNGAKVDSVKVPCGPNSTPTPLSSGAVIDIGGTQMMFILPDAQPKVSGQMLDQVAHKIPKPKNKKTQFGNPYANGQKGSSMTIAPSSNMKPFHMFNDDGGVSSDMNGSSMESDFSKDEARDIKPPYSYATMITQAILSNDDGVLSLSEIYEWISRHYAFYRFSKSGWQNSIRHNLSLNKAFEKVPRRPNEPGKGMKWQISDSYKDEFMKKFQNGSLSKARRGSSVSRQLQLHLAKHNDLPASQSQRHKVGQPPYTPPLQYQPPDALQFMANAAPNPPGQPSFQGPPQGFQGPPPQGVPYGQYAPPQLPPLQQQQSSLPYPQQPIPGHYTHSRGSSIGSAPFPPPSAPYGMHPQQAQPLHQQPHDQSLQQQVPPPPSQQHHQPQQQQQQQQQQQHQAQASAEAHQIQQEQHQQPPQQQQQHHEQQPQQAPQSAESHESSKTSATRDQENIRPTTNDTSTASEARGDMKSENHTSQLSSPGKSEQKFPPLYPSNKFYNNDEGNSTNETKAETNNSHVDYGLISSPSKSFSVSAVEAYTPERGARKKDDGDNNGSARDVVNGNNLQSSPALWNFVQFSTPLGPGQDRKEQPSPTKNGFQLPDSPLNMKTKESKNDGELNVDLAKGFKKE